MITIDTKVSNIIDIEKIQNLSPKEFCDTFLPEATCGWDNFSKVFAINYCGIIDCSKVSMEDAFLRTRDKMLNYLIKGADLALLRFLETSTFMRIIGRFGIIGRLKGGKRFASIVHWLDFRTGDYMDFTKDYTGYGVYVNRKCKRIVKFKSENIEDTLDQFYRYFFKDFMKNNDLS